MKAKMVSENLNENISNEIRKDIQKRKRKLIQSWKKSGGYENFGQKEVMALEDKYSDYRYQKEFDLIRAFDNWCMNYTGDTF